MKESEALGQSQNPNIATMLACPEVSLDNAADILTPSVDDNTAIQFLDQSYTNGARETKSGSNRQPKP